MIRHIIAFIILGALALLLGFYYMNPDSYVYQSGLNQHVPNYDALEDNIPNSKYETTLAKDYPFIFWLVENQVWIFLICVLLSLCNLIYNYYQKGKLYRFIHKIYKG